MSDKYKKQVLLRYFALEGVDKVGKTTIFNKLKDEFKNNKNIIFVSEPSTKLKKVIYYIIKNKLAFIFLRWILPFLFYFDRLFHIKKVKEYIKNGFVVASDRCVLSSFVYQGFLGWFLNKNLPIPEHIFFIKLRRDFLEKRHKNIKNLDSIESNFKAIKNNQDYYEFILKKLYSNNQFSYSHHFNEQKVDLIFEVDNISRILILKTNLKGNAYENN